MHARFLLGPAGSGKTFRCLAEIRAALCTDPEGDPLILLAPKQATFQLERQLFADPTLPGYTRLQILSFERLAEFILDQRQLARPALLSEEGRVMVLRALLLQKQGELQIFRASARLTGFAQQLSLLLREFQRHRLSPARLAELAAERDNPPLLRAKLHDLALLLRAYGDVLQAQQLQDANHLLDVASDALRPPSSALRISALWLDGFAEMTPQELDLLAALMPFCEQATLAFCLETEPEAETSWLSPWSVVAQTFRQCHARLASIAGGHVTVETLTNRLGIGRFAANQMLATLAAHWSQPAGLSLTPDLSPRTEYSHGAKADSTDPASVKTAIAADEATRSHDLELGSGGNQSETGVPTAIRLASCANPESEAVLAAREIWRHVRAGGSYRECAIMVRRLDPYQATIARVFRRYEIPFFMDRREAVAHHPLTELTRFAFRTVTFGWRHDDWFGALKSGLVSARADLIDELENEALAHGWEGKVWREPLSIRQESDRGQRLETLRGELVAPFIGFTTALAENSFAPTGNQVAAAVRELWQALKVDETLTHWSEAITGESATASRRSVGQMAFHSAVLEQMHDWLDNVERAFAAEALPLRDWLPILEAGLANLTVGVVPPALDEVLIGAVDRSRNPELKLALVLGLNEGVFPAPPAPATLLTDAERSGLEQQGLYLGPTRYQRLGHERYLGYIACTRARERLVLTCAAQDIKGQSLNPSPFLDHIQRLTGVTKESFPEVGAWWESEHLCELEAPALRSQNDEGERTRAGVLCEISALRPVLQKWRQVQLAHVTDPLLPGVVEKIFGHELKSSVSGLEDFAACPFKFFAARGLRLQERKEFQFDDRDKGSFQHDVLEEFHRRIMASGRQWRELTPTEAGGLITAIGRELLPQFGTGKFQAGGAARFAGDYLIARLRRLVTALVAWLPQYEFDPSRSEIAFDDEPDALPAWRLELGDDHCLSLRGRIDRVDLLRRADHSALAVVMDYKSRVRKLDATKLYHGLELQLLSYLGVLQHLPKVESYFGVNQLVPAGVFYVPLNGGSGSPGKTRADVLAGRDEGQPAAYQHSGRFLADELGHFDNRNLAKGDQFKYAKNKGGDLAKRGNEALPAAEFEALREKVEGHLRDYGRRIFAGEVAVTPFRIGTNTACDYCDFRPVCRFDPWTQPFRDLRPPPKPATDVAPKQPRRKSP